MPSKTVIDIDGSEAVSKILLDLLNKFPGLTTGNKSILFSTLSDASGIGFFPISGAALQSSTEDVTGHVTQVCQYPFNVVYRAAPKTETQRIRIKEFLDALGKWLERQPVTLNGKSHQLSAYPALLAGKANTSTVWNGVKATLSSTWSNIKSTASSTWNSMKTTASSAWNSMKSTASSTWSNIKSSLSSTWNSIKSTASSTWSGIKNAIQNQGWSGVGSNICNGIANGINSGWSWLKNKVSSLASSLLSAAKSALGIHSPSRLFRDEIGLNIGYGVGEGVEASQPSILKSVSGVADAIADEFNAGDYKVGNIVPTSEVDGALSSFSDKISGSFTSLLDRLQAIADNITFAVPAVAGGVVPYKTAAAAASGGGADIGTTIETSNDALASVVTQVVTNATAAIVTAIQNYSGTTVNFDKTAIAESTIREINRRTRATGKSPLE